MSGQLVPKFRLNLRCLLFTFKDVKKGLAVTVPEPIVSV